MHEQIPLVSVIIPCYNAERFISEAIQSALDQTWRNMEVIVIDDGSTDGSLDVIRSFGDRIVCETGPNRGGCAARNRGIELAKGEFIQFLDADDILLPACVEEKVRFRLEHPCENPVCDIEYRSLDGRSRTVTWELRDPDDPFCALVQLSPQISRPLSTAAELRRCGGFRDSLRCLQDTDLHIRLAHNGTQFVRLPQTLVIVRQTAGSVSSDPMRMSATAVEWGIQLAQELDSAGELTRKRANLLAKNLAISGRNALRWHDWDLAKLAFDNARRLTPDGWLEAYPHTSAKCFVRAVGPLVAEIAFQQYRRMRTAVSRT